MQLRHNNNNSPFCTLFFVLFSAENCPNGSLPEVAKFHTNTYNFLACLLPAIHTNSLFWMIFEELPFCHFPHLNTSVRGKGSQS